MKNRSKIPSEAEFAHAKQKMSERIEKANKYKLAIISARSNRFPCHDLWLWLSNSELTVSYIFPSDSDLEKHQNTDLKKALEGEIEQALGNLDIENVIIKHHSHEHISKKYNGNYEKYFR